MSLSQSVLLIFIMVGDLYMVSACSESSVLLADLTLVTILIAGMLVGITVKFNPFCSKAALQYR